MYERELTGDDEVGEARQANAGHLGRSIEKGVRESSVKTKYLAIVGGEYAIDLPESGKVPRRVNCGIAGLRDDASDSYLYFENGGGRHDDARWKSLGECLLT